jgi:hypothetical protein
LRADPESRPPIHRRRQKAVHCARRVSEPR